MHQLTNGLQVALDEKTNRKTALISPASQRKRMRNNDPIKRFRPSTGKELTVPSEMNSAAFFIAS